MLTGMIEKNVLIDTFRTPSLTISRQGQGPAHIDGEPLNMASELDIVCHPSSLRVVSPRKSEEVKPFITPATAMFSDFKLAVNKLFHQI